MSRWTMPALAALLLLSACGPDDSRVEGYVEGDYLRVGLPAAGQVASVAVERGQTVAAGDPLFALDDTAERAALAEAEARLEEARHNRDNLLTGKRALEIRAIEAQKAQAEASLRYSELQLHRQSELAPRGAASQAAFDQAKAAMDRDRNRVAELTANLGFAREGARSAEIAAAQSAVVAAEQAVTQAKWYLDQRAGRAPKAGRVEDVLFHEGEEVAAGQPVVSLLPPGNLFFRFFLSPEQVGRVATGATLRVACAGCPPDLGAKVTYIAREASFAPPVIYSRENKAKLVFLVEARPLSPSPALHPGQPATLTLPGGTAK